MGSSVASLDHATVHYADLGIHVKDDASVTLGHVESKWNDDGLRVEGTGPPSVHATGCTFSENESKGVRVTAEVPGIDVTINRSEIAFNKSSYENDFYATGSANQVVLHARENWWGSTSTEMISRTIQDATDTWNLPIVDWCGYLDGPGGTPRDVHCPNLSVTGSETLDRTEKPYLVTSLFKVWETGTLIVEPGVEIRFVSQVHDTGFDVLGDLQINGTATSPVTLTSDTADEPWDGQEVIGGTATIRHADISPTGSGCKCMTAAR